MHAADAVFAAIVGALALLGYAATDPTGSQRAPDLFGGLLIAGQTGSFVARRLRPWWSLVGVVLFSIVFWGADYPSELDVFTALSIYAATAHGGDDRRRVWVRVGATVALLTGFATLGVLSELVQEVGP